MEVRVLSASNLSLASTVIAIHTGDVRRKAKLEVDRPFALPKTRNGKALRMEVFIFNQLASMMLPESKDEVFIPFQRKDKDSSEVKLRIRRSASSKPVTVDADEAGSLARTQTYLNEHNLQDCVQNLIQDVLRAQPAEPFRHMLETLKAQKAQKASQSKTRPVEPRPPEKPRPAGDKKPIAGGRIIITKCKTNDQLHTESLARSVVRMVLGMPKCLEAAQADANNAASRLTAQAVQLALSCCLAEQAEAG